jgi:hypothetical protein
MKTKKIITKKGYTAVIIEDEFTSIVLVNGNYNIYLNSPTYGKPCEDQSGQEPFIKAYEDFKNKKESERLEKIEIARIAEEKRIQEIKDTALQCESPSELIDSFNLTIVETASHWSDLYEGRSGYAIKINSRQEFEDFEIIKNILNINGEYVELRNRAGEHHCTSNSQYDLDSYQKALKNHFNGDHFFFSSKETEHDLYLEKIKEADDIEEIESILKDYNKIETGYYDCNGNLEMLEEDLESDNITGYRYDVYSYFFGFEFTNKNSFNQNEKDEEE